MKIVINSCFGGFGLSKAGHKEYLKRKGKEAYFYIQTKYKHRVNGIDEYERVDDTTIDGLYTITSTVDLGKTIDESPNESDRFYDRDLERTDPDLIAVVEELKEKADGQFAKLNIVEIPEGVEWGISEYDGQETVEEKHRSWS